MTDETKEQILQKADAQARSLAGQAKDYTQEFFKKILNQQYL